MISKRIIDITSPLCISVKSAPKRNFASKVFKEKYAKVRPLKTPTMIAMDNFDFYYGPVYGNQWPSIRLGLLTPNKYFAVLNKFARNRKENEALLKDFGAFNVLERVQQQVVENDNIHVECEEPILSDDIPEGENSVIAQKVDENELDSVNMRGEEGLGHFRHSGEIASLEERTRLQSQSSKDVNLRKINITGFEGQYTGLRTKNHLLTYPDELAIYSFPKGDLSDYPPPPKDEVGTPGWWLLDGGSVVPVLALGLTKESNILDMCAAPGGKSLLILQTDLMAKLTCNDNKQSRLGQLHRALGQYIPVNSDVADRIILKRKDASVLESWDECNSYDTVLADVPCTSDRLSVNRDDGNLYSTHLTEQRLNLPQVQTRMLVNALRSVRVGGSVVYSTCALSPVQNDGVIENSVAIAEEYFGIKAVELSLSQMVSHFKNIYRFSDKPRRGLLVLPFLPSNCGPMYVCKLQRIQ
uniref:NOL1/NOP2/Sun domain family member 4 n=1 Tax=Elaeophora elaphi TaxID=1147741 RepID=A0A0R3RXQ9_9BILA